MKIRQIVMQAVLELACQMETIIKPWRGNSEVALKYTDRTPYEEWVVVSFKPETSAQRDLIYEKLTELRELGVGFDTGAGCGSIDWELDWSLSEIDELSVARKSKSEPIIEVNLPDIG